MFLPVAWRRSTLRRPSTEQNHRGTRLFSILAFSGAGQESNCLSDFFRLYGMLNRKHSLVLLGCSWHACQFNLDQWCADSLGANSIGPDLSAAKPEDRDDYTLLAKHTVQRIRRGESVVPVLALQDDMSNTTLTSLPFLSAGSNNWR